MLTGLHPSTQRFLEQLRRLQAAHQQAIDRSSSGRTLLKPSDAPDSISEVLSLRAQLQRYEQLGKNLNRVELENRTAEKALDTALKLLDRAKVLAAQATGPNFWDQRRDVLAVEVRELQRQMVDLANSAVDGRYIFAGDRDQQPPYRLNLDADVGAEAFNVSEATRLVENPSGEPFLASRTAGEIFDARNPDETPADSNVFNALQQLRVALENEDEDAILAAMGKLEAASKHLNTVLSFYGSVQNQIDAAQEKIQKFTVDLQQQLHELEEADLGEEISRLIETRLAIEASLKTQAEKQRNNLFDFLR